MLFNKCLQDLTAASSLLFKEIVVFVFSVAQFRKHNAIQSFWGKSLNATRVEHIYYVIELRNSVTCN